MKRYGVLDVTKRDIISISAYTSKITTCQELQVLLIKVAHHGIESVKIMDIAMRNVCIFRRCYLNLWICILHFIALWVMKTRIVKNMTCSKNGQWTCITWREKNTNRQRGRRCSNHQNFLHCSSNFPWCRHIFLHCNRGIIKCSMLCSNRSILNCIAFKIHLNNSRSINHSINSREDFTVDSEEEKT